MKEQQRSLTMTIRPLKRETVRRIRNGMVVSYLILVTGYIVGKNTKPGRVAWQRGRNLVASANSTILTRIIGNKRVEGVLSRVMENERVKKMLSSTQK